MKKIYVSADIYIREEPKGFSATGYKINVNEPSMNVLYRKYKEHNGFGQNQPLSDRDRLAFEKLITSLIDKGRIIVRK